MNESRHNDLNFQGNYYWYLSVMSKSVF